MTENILVCANHPNRETTLRCNRCEKPICAQCAVQTPVGYRCRECVKGQQKTFDNSIPMDYPIAAFISLVCVGGATAVLDFLGFWGLFVAPVVGGGIVTVGAQASISRVRARSMARIMLCGDLMPIQAIPRYNSISYYACKF